MKSGFFLTRAALVFLLLSAGFPAPLGASRRDICDNGAALPLWDGSCQDSTARPICNGGATNCGNSSLYRCKISDPATGPLDARPNIDPVHSMEVDTSRFSAENRRGSAGVVDLKTK